MLSEEETMEIKEQIIQQIESTFPEEQKESAIQQIEAMDSEQLESFLEKNRLLKNSSNESGDRAGESKCVFCSIVSGGINSCKIGENEGAIAVLEINPISKAHSMIIPKVHSDKAGKEALTLAKEISAKIKKKLKPKSIEISKSKLFGHEVINILPIYENETFNSKRSQAQMEDLEKIKEELEKQPEKKIKIKKPKLEEIKEILKLPKHIP
jgi:diadenosine tetraphosphate (Ap4A) HIT family hydrolase